ncbi:unnamed protein product [Mytilus coruscus]|uniref:HECT domain-containing protein n=1 Tax=Mytilus coruscus TaxID=42192 RepID=A0A6J8AFC9_MYTCO|nr:unnamed protein product [Mytilus coruscus]
MVQQFNIRFGEHAVSVVRALALIPSIIHQTSDDAIDDIVGYYEVDMPYPDSCRREFRLWNELWRDQTDKPSTLTSTVTDLRLCSTIFPKSERTEEENGDDNDFVIGFANFRTQHDSRPGQTAASGAYRRRTNPVYSFKAACLDSPEFTSISPMMIRRLNKCGLGSRKIVISRSDSVINFKKRVIELFPKLERVDFEFFQAKLREKHRLEQVSTSDTPDSSRSHQRNSTLSQPGTSGASSSIEINPVQIQSAAEPLPLPPIRHPRRRTATAANDFIRAVNSTESSSSSRNTGSARSNLTRVTTQNSTESRRNSPARQSDLAEVITQNSTENRRNSPSGQSNLVGVTQEEVRRGHRYQELGTPIVQIRREVAETARRSILDLSTENVVNLDETLQNDVFIVADFIPAVPASVVTSSLPSVTEICDAIKEHKKNFISGDEENPLLMEDLHNPLRISFVGELGVDLGGLRREFWSLFLYKLSNSMFMKGTPGAQTFRKNIVERLKHTYFHLRHLVALSILEDGPGVPILSNATTDYILHGRIKSVVDSDLGEIQEVFQKMESCITDSDLQAHYCDIIEEASAVGFLVPVNKMTKKHLPVLKTATVQNHIEGAKEELDDFFRGLDTHQILSFLRRDDNILNARTLVCGRIKPLTALALKDLLVFKYSEGNRKIKELAAAHGFLTFIQASKGDGASVNGITVKPENILMWLTYHIPAAGFHKQIDVLFGDVITINTCALCFTLKLSDMTIEQAVEHYTEYLINSQTFTVE